VNDNLPEGEQRFAWRREQHFSRLTRAFARCGRELAGWLAAHDFEAAAPAAAFITDDVSDPAIGYRLHVVMPGERAIEIRVANNGPPIVTLLEYGCEFAAPEVRLEMSASRFCEWASLAFQPPVEPGSVKRGREP
jgi:hypothetical protein